MSSRSSVRTRIGLGLAVAAAIVVSPTAATAAPKPRLMAKEACKVLPGGQQAYGVQVTGKGLRAENPMLDVGFSAASFGDSVVIQVDEKGRFFYVALREPPMFITAFAQGLFDGADAKEVRIDRPCQRD